MFNPLCCDVHLIVDELLVKLDHEGHNTLGYTNDLVILTQSKFNNIVRDEIQNAVRVVQEKTEEDE